MISLFAAQRFFASSTASAACAEIYLTPSEYRNRFGIDEGTENSHSWTIISTKGSSGEAREGGIRV